MTFQKGVPNPVGRPRGSSYKTELFMTGVMPRRMEICQLVIDNAFAGDTKCLLFLAERLFPGVKDLAVQFSLPDTVKEEDLFRLGEDVIRLIGDGSITPEQGQIITNTIKTHRDSLVIKQLIDQVKGLNDKVEKLEK